MSNNSKRYQCTSIQNLKFFTEENSNSTYFRVDSSTYTIYADAPTSQATVFKTVRVTGPEDVTYSIEWADRPGYFMTLVNDHQLIMTKIDPSNEAAIFKSGVAKQSGLYDDIYYLANNNLMINRDIQSSLVSASKDPNINPTPKTCIIESVVIV